MIYFFTGAGVSADSGIPTFRDAGGIWTKHKLEEVCYLPAFLESPENRKKAYDFHNQLKMDFKDALPNAGHFAIAELEQKTPVKVFTTNVDMLHEMAGSKDVVHLHGSMTEMNCPACGYFWEIGSAPFAPTPCPMCNSGMTKPGGIFFDEPSPRYYELYKAIKSLTHGDIFVIVGASLIVTNPISIIRRAGKLEVTRVLFVDKKLPIEVTLPGVEGYQGSSAEILPELLPPLLQTVTQ